ncbi:hypothetical protein V6N11_051141 [Hibiscus sabdariffa]|uniref:GAG-pre-integrase domain-containing protein n=1 Tax=Hibiscus sabdariffa TaxID=183260 RepID=A0ABR2R3B8_9ROSI
MMALKYKEGTSTADHVSEFQSVMNQLLGMGVKFDDEILGLWFLATLPDSWEKSQVSLINSAPRDIITLDLAKSGVLNEEKGHIKKYCFKLKRENKGGCDKYDWNDEEKFEHTAVTRGDLLVICDENLVNLACNETSWVIDTGASIHVTSRRDFFTSYTHGDFGILKMGNERLVWVTRMGDVSLVSNNGASDGQWKLTKGSLVVARGKKSSNLYLMQDSTSRDTVNVIINDSSTELWHKWLSHMSEKGLSCLAKNNQFSGLKNATLKNCVHCLVGNQRRVSFSSRPPHRKLELLELTIDEIDKTKKEDSPDSGDLTDVNTVPLDHSLNPIQDDVHGDVNDDQQDIGDFDAPIDDVVNDQQQAPIAPPTVPLQRSFIDRRFFVRSQRIFSLQEKPMLRKRKREKQVLKLSFNFDHIFDRRFIPGPVELIFGQQLDNVVILIVYGWNFHPSLITSEIAILQLAHF